MARKRPLKKPKTAKRPPNGPPPPDIPTGPPPEPADRPLDQDERRFVDEWLVDRQPTVAYMRANPTLNDWRNGRAQARNLMLRPWVRAEMQAAAHAQSVRTQIRADSVLKEISRLANSDVLDLFDPATNLLRSPRHIPLDTRRCIASVKVGRARTTERRNNSTRTTVVDTVIEYKLWPKNDALGKLANYLGLNTSIPPLEAMLSALPKDLAEQIRSAIAEQMNGLHPEITEPSTNGKH